MANGGNLVMVSTPKEADAFMQAQLAEMSNIIQALDIKMID